MSVFKIRCPKTIINYIFFLILYSFSLINNSLHATNYYFSSSSGNDSYSSIQAQNSSTPWATIKKLNAVMNSFLPGDNIYFKRGDVFYGAIIVTKSGTNINPISFDSYGSGNKPIITGLTTLNTWTVVNSNIYQVNVTVAPNNLNLVVVNGIPQQMGRFPNYNYPADPYLYYQSFNSSGTSFTSNQLSNIINWTGAEIVIKKRRWVLDRSKITSQVGTTINCTNPSNYPGTANFGFFIQNDPRTLDKFGEWYFDTTRKNLQLYLGGNPPSSYTIKIATLDNLLNLGDNNFINIRNLSLEGANSTGLLSQNGGDITIVGCDFNAMGKNGISITNSPNILVDNILVNNVLNNGVIISNSVVNNVVVRNSTIKNCGIFPGLGNSGDVSYMALNVGVNSTSTIEYNIIDSVGYNGIVFQGSNVTVRNNFINNYCMVKDDGGGIYTWANNNINFTNRKIISNIVLNAKGDPFGTSGRTAEAKGIYLDGGSTNIDISNNSIAYIARTGLLLNNSENLKLIGNTVYDARFGMEIVRLTSAAPIRNIDIRRNVLYPKDQSQASIYYKNMYLSLPTPINIQQDMQSIGVLDSNYYATPNEVGFGYFYCQNYDITNAITTPPPLSLVGWKSFINKDLASKRAANSPVAINLQRFEYNATNFTKTITLDAKYLGPDSTVYNGSITLAPYTSVVLVNLGPISNPISINKTFTVNTSSVSCFGSNTIASVIASGGTAPYTGTGTYSVAPGIGTLKINVSAPVAGLSTLIYSNIGAVSNNKNYVLQFSTLGTTTNGSLKAGLRLTSSPYSNTTSLQTKTFGTIRVNHSFLFTAPPSSTTTSFIIQLLQSSGTTYIDNIAFFEANSEGAIVSDNLFTEGQFENNINSVFTWSSTNNHVATLDLTGKISNTNYYKITDFNGLTACATVPTMVPGAALQVTSRAGTITTLGGSTTVIVEASGGIPPYIGTGSFANVGVGSYTYTITDSAGCTARSNLTINQPVNLSASASASSISCFGGNTAFNITATGGTAPYIGTGNYIVNAGSGCLKVSVSAPVVGSSTLIYSNIGAINNAKNYTLRFSTLGSTDYGSLKAALRQSASPWNYVTSKQTATFSTTRVDHEFFFAAPPTSSATSFIIELLQTSGITYIDNIAFFEASASGKIIGANLYQTGQFETSNLNSTLFTWSNTNNHIAEIDSSSKISNTYYFRVTDATGAASTATGVTNQPKSALKAIASSGNINVAGGTTTIIVSASGGTAPYTGIGSFPNIKAGTYNYNVTDANGCSFFITITVAQTAARSENTTTMITANERLYTSFNSRDLEVNVYPNPANYEVNLIVQGGPNKIVEIIVFSVDGRFVYGTQGTSNRTYKFGSNLPPGFYIIKILQGTTTQTIKVLKSVR